MRTTPNIIIINILLLSFYCSVIQDCVLTTTKTGPVLISDNEPAFTGEYGNNGHCYNNPSDTVASRSRPGTNIAPTELLSAAANISDAVNETCYRQSLRYTGIGDKCYDINLYFSIFQFICNYNVDRVSHGAAGLNGFGIPTTRSAKPHVGSYDNPPRASDESADLYQAIWLRRTTLPIAMPPKSVPMYDTRSQHYPWCQHNGVSCYVTKLYLDIFQYACERYVYQLTDGTRGHESVSGYIVKQRTAFYSRSMWYPVTDHLASPNHVRQSRPSDVTTRERWLRRTLPVVTTPPAITIFCFHYMRSYDILNDYFSISLSAFINNTLNGAVHCIRWLLNPYGQASCTISHVICQGCRTLITFCYASKHMSYLVVSTHDTYTTEPIFYYKLRLHIDLIHLSVISTYSALYLQRTVATGSHIVYTKSISTYCNIILPYVESHSVGIDIAFNSCHNLYILQDDYIPELEDGALSKRAKGLTLDRPDRATLRITSSLQTFQRHPRSKVWPISRSVPTLCSRSYYHFCIYMQFVNPKRLKTANICNDKPMKCNAIIQAFRIVTRYIVLSNNSVNIDVHIPQLFMMYKLFRHVPHYVNANSFDIESIMTLYYICKYSERYLPSMVRINAAPRIFSCEIPAIIQSRDAYCNYISDALYVFYIFISIPESCVNYTDASGADTAGPITISSTRAFIHKYTKALSGPPLQSVQNLFTVSLKTMPTKRTSRTIYNETFYLVESMLPAVNRYETIPEMSNCHYLQSRKQETSLYIVGSVLPTGMYCDRSNCIKERTWCILKALRVSSHPKACRSTLIVLVFYYSPSWYVKRLMPSQLYSIIRGALDTNVDRILPNLLHAEKL